MVAAGRYLAWVTPPRSIRLLLGHAIDYAGLFPPAALACEQAAANYQTYRTSAAAWALGRFVCPAERLPELAAVLDAADPGAAAEPWRVAATLGEDWPADRARILRFNARSDARVDAVEGRTPDSAAVGRLALFGEDGLAAYGETPPAGDGLDATLEALRAAGLAAKIRMGGVTAERFPAAGEVARFLAAAHRADAPFKATAGLHHAIRGEFPLTYEPESRRATMFGFLNFLLAGLVVRAGGDPGDAVAALEERSSEAFGFDDAGASWRGRRFALAELEAFRSRFHGFGSCSFREPIDALAEVIRR